jgi:hypothetical protein
MLPVAPMSEIPVQVLLLQEAARWGLPNHSQTWGTHDCSLQCHVLCLLSYICKREVVHECALCTLKNISKNKADMNDFKTCVILVTLDFLLLKFVLYIIVH